MTTPRQTSIFAQRLEHVLGRIRSAAGRSGRDPGAIQLLAVSKTRTAGEVREAIEAGVSAFGENYLQEALDKMAALEGQAVEWHFIGPVQSNKTAAIAEHFHWVHSIDRDKIARRLSQQRPTDMPPLQCCVQVNIDRESTKSGVMAEECEALADVIAALPGLQLRGLMAIPARQAESSDAFQQMAQLLKQLRQNHPELDTLSMGMSADLEEAIAHGSTIVRVGSALFGPRNQ